MTTRPTRRRYSISSWTLLLETALYLLAMAVAKRVVPFRLVSRILGSRVEAPTAPPLPPAVRSDLLWAFSAVQLPPLPQVLCLTEVLALALLLRRRGLRGSAHLGVTYNAPFQAHAWMLCGNTILPRRQDLTPYRVVGIFEPG